MAVFLSDNFVSATTVLLQTRTAPVGGNWVKYSGTDQFYVAASNHASAWARDKAFVDSGGGHLNYLNTLEPSNALGARFKASMGKFAVTPAVGMVVRLNPANGNRYQAAFQSGTFTLSKVVSGVFTTLGTAACLYDANQVERPFTVELIPDGTSLIIKVYDDGALVIEAVDASPLALGYAGLVGEGGAFFDNFLGETIESTDTPPPARWLDDAFSAVGSTLVLPGRKPTTGARWLKFSGGDELYVADSAHAATWVRNKAFINSGGEHIQYSPTIEPTTPFGNVFEMDIGYYGGTPAVGLIFRVKGTSFYAVYANRATNLLYIVKYNPTASVLTSVAYTFGAIQTSKKLKVVARQSGTTLNIKAYIDDALQLSHDDTSALPRGGAGLIGTAGAFWDNFYAEAQSSDGPVSATLTSSGNTSTASFAGQARITRTAALSSAGTSAMSVGTFWFATGYLTIASVAAVDAKSVPFITRSATLSAAGQGVVTARGRSTAQSSATFEGSQSVFSPISNSLIEGEGIFKSEGAGSTAAFVSSVYNGSKLTAAGTSPVAFKGQVLGNTLTASGTSTATFWQFGRVNAGTLSAAGTSNAAFLPFGRIVSATLTSAGSSNATFGDIIKARLTSIGVGVASFQGRPRGTGKLSSFNNPPAVDFTSAGLTKTDFTMFSNSTTLFRSGAKVRFHAYIIG